MRAELLKLRTARGTWLLLGLAQLIVIAGVSGLMVSRDHPTDEAAQQGAVAHVGLVALFTLLLGIVAMAGEYRHRTITDAFLAVPRRERVVLAKLVVAAGAGAVFGLAASATALITDAIWLAAKGASIDLSSAELWRAVTGGFAWNIAFAVLGVGVGALITNLNAAIAAALAWLALVEGIVAQLLGEAGKWLPFALGSALTGLPNNVDGPARWVAGLVLAAYAIAMSAVALATTMRRDVT
jgi:ABC-2 type transport system permease protein